MLCAHSISDLPADSVFDGILLNDVLEHVPDPKVFLQQLKGHLSSRHSYMG